MPFKTFQEVKTIGTKEPLLVWLEAPANTGKSTLIAELYRKFNPGVIIPMDHRAGLFADLAAEGVTRADADVDRAEHALVVQHVAR